MTLPSAAKRFTEDTAEHVMTVLHDDGLYRHIRFAEPGTGMYHFDLVTWPGYLTISGDMGCYTFRRDLDMFEFFTHKGAIGYRYWAEKAQNAGEIREYSERLFRQLVTEHFEDYARDEDMEMEQRAALWTAITDDVLRSGHSDDEAHGALDAFGHDGFEFYDTWEWDLKDFTFRFLWICHAIQSGVQQYRAAVVPGAAARPEQVAA